MREKGFIPILILIGFAVVGTVSYFFVSTIKRNELINNNSESSERDYVNTPLPGSTETNLNSPTSTPKINTNGKNTPTPKSTNVSTRTSTPTPANQNTTNNSCNYNTTNASGAIQFIFVPSNGNNLYWSTVAEIKSLNGCRVLDGNSTDTIQRFKSAGSNNLSIPSIPAGIYQVRTSYHDVWSSTQTVTVSSGQQSNVTFNVNNSTDPTSTPVATPIKPTCSSITGNPSTTGNAPFYTLLCSQIGGGPSITIQTIYWDFEGDGTWDITTNIIGCQGHTYNSPGTYNPKTYVTATNGQQSDICSTTVTVN